MDLKEIVDLIAIRQYVRNAIEFYSIEKSTISELNGIYKLLDKKIINLVTSPNFKEFIGFNDINKAVQEETNNSNIKSGLQKK